MDLRYINPYYLNLNTRSRARSMTRAVTYSVFQTPIFDRTAVDVNLVNTLIQKGYENFTNEEKQLWLSDLKGALNANDLNRIENNMSILANCVEISITSKTNWAKSDIPYEEDFKRIHDNLLLIRNCPTFKDLSFGEVPELPYNDFDKINEIERLQFLMYNNLTGQFNCYCTNRPGNNTLTQLYCGESIQ